MDNMPDNVILNILSFLDEITLDKASFVCKRWYYLVNTTELWLFKCKKLAQRENLGNIESLLIDEMKKNEDIDWRLAYIELNELIKNLKERYLAKYKQFYARKQPTLYFNLKFCFIID